MRINKLIRRLLINIALKIYNAAKNEEQLHETKRRYSFLESNSTLKSNTIIDNNAIIENHRNDRSKLVIGERTYIQGHLMLFKHGGEITIGDYSFVGRDTRIWSAKKINIGNRVLIAHNVNIHDNISHPLNSLERHKDFVHILNTSGFQTDIDLREEEVIIEDDVWIGFNSTIFKGVRIGKGAIIGACTLVTKDIPPFSVVVGNPARIIKTTT